MVVLWAVPVTLYFLRKYLSSFSSSEIELSALNYRAPGGSMVTLDKVIPFENILDRKLCESAMQAFRRKIATPNRRDRASLSLAYHAYWSIYHGEERYALISPGKCTCNFKDEFTLCASGARFELSQLIKSKPSLLTSTDSTGATLLYIACRGGFLDVVDMILRQGANINACQLQGNTPLHVAAWYRHLPIVQLLLRCGADITIRNVAGNTALEECDWAVAAAIKKAKK